jgi:Holliday junction resolvase RusA-like endonuclease
MILTTSLQRTNQMLNAIRFTLWLNPEPWAVGTISTGRKQGKFFSRMSPDPNLAAYQQAVREELSGASKLPENFTKLTFFFWRQRAAYLDAADRRRHRNQADATNMQKGLEDALQGILFDNDRDVRDIRSVIMEQGPKVEPCIVIQAEPAQEQIDILTEELGAYLYDQIRKAKSGEFTNEWPPRS